ncbi:hypothetical protein FORC31_p175 (plasmid) [Escherichia coli]|nr:hypothetical protein FORC31_p175 [Escherichia coli]
MRDAKNKLRELRKSFSVKIKLWQNLRPCLCYGKSSMSSGAIAGKMLVNFLYL